MKDTIKHPEEPISNAARCKLDQFIGRGQRTYTPSQVVVAKAKGSLLWTVEGRRLYDFTSGVLVSNLGHAHAGFERAYRAYTAKLPRTAYNMCVPVEIEAAERLIKSMSMPKAQKLLWAASGSEGIQKAMWCALHRKPESPIMVATRGGFHGKKGLAGDVSGENSPNPNVRFISFPMYEEKPQSFYQAELDALAKEFPGKIALLITEPYLGAKGSFHPPKWYHRMLQDWCKKHDIAFIFDEVQACHGRTGNMYAFQTYGVEPDLVVLGKGLGNGEPVAAVVGRADLIDALEYGEGSDTYSGNPHACAAVCAVLDVFKEEKIVAQARKAAVIVGRKLQALKKKFPFIKDVRGEGLVYGVEMADNEIANQCVLEAYLGTGKQGVHFLGALAGKVLRVSPPLVITAEELDAAFAILEKAWNRVKSA